MKSLLFAKAWVLFGFIFICGAWTSPSPLKEIINSVSVFTAMLWVYAIGVYGQERIAELGLKTMKTRFFKTNLTLGLVTYLAYLISIIIDGRIDFSTTDNSVGPIDILITAIVLYLIFISFQTTIFAAKTLTKIELRREVSFNDYFTNLICMFFFVIGVWFLQPKVNRLIGDKITNPPSNDDILTWGK